MEYELAPLLGEAGIATAIGTVERRYETGGCESANTSEEERVRL
jgi:hypothetical protein